MVKALLTNWAFCYTIAQNVNKQKLLPIIIIIPELTYVTEMSEWLDTKSSVKLDGFRF